MCMCVCVCVSNYIFYVIYIYIYTYIKDGQEFGGEMNWGCAGGVGEAEGGWVLSRYIVPCIQFSKNIVKIKVEDRQNFNYPESVSSTVVGRGLFTEMS